MPALIGPIGAAELIVLLIMVGLPVGAVALVATLVFVTMKQKPGDSRPNGLRGVSRKTDEDESDEPSCLKVYRRRVRAILFVDEIECACDRNHEYGRLRLLISDF